MSDALSFTEHTPVIDYLQNLLAHAISKSASDIHFEPVKTAYRIRIRRDGLLQVVSTPTTRSAHSLIARIKILAQLDIAEKRLPQEGRFQYIAALTDPLDIRVSICPTVQGEKVVLRIINPQPTLRTLEQLGYEPWQHQLVSHSLHQAHGLILVTGPTGSGKTVSLYAALQMLNTTHRSLITIEDPVELELAGVSQIQIHRKLGFTFSKALRTCLRHDPDVILIGEIRDQSTARTAIQAAQTGHLVLSTLHTSSAGATFLRLQQWGFTPEQLAHAITLIIAQRLIRTICNVCRGKSACTDCQSGYHGRTGIYECLPMTRTLRSALLHPTETIDFLDHRWLAKHQTLYQAGLNKVTQGITYREEIDRVVSTH